MRYYVAAIFLLLVFATPIRSSAQPVHERSAGTLRTDERGIPQVWVPAGRFIAGSTQEQVDIAYQTCLDIRPGMCLWQEYTAELYQHTSTITNGYWIDQYEVTNAAYDAFIKDGGYTTREYWSDDGWLWKGNRTGPTTDCPPEFLTSDLPRACITWYEADAYAHWRGGSLPTEAEWEYAARGTEGWIYPWGDTFDGTQLNYCDSSCPNIWGDTRFNDGYARTSPVGSYSTNWINAYDMAGNVWEWTLDWYDASYHQRDTHPAVGIEKVLRGGSWNMPYIFSRTAYRDGVLPDSWSSIIGFRIVHHERPPLP
jgi:formylglycine-generating enzyme required for sulfatase activity